jgi:hypothetical protein
MVIVLNVLNPELDDTAPAQPETADEVKTEKEDRTRLTRLQVISITGELVDVLV